MFPGLGRDTMTGGAGDDEVSYSDRTARVEVTLDDVANDGEVGEQDNVRADMEDVVTGAGPDKIVGNGAANVLEGNGGVDFIDAGAGDDFLGGGTGNDTLRGGDDSDTLSGGPDHDTLEAGRGDDRLQGNDGDDILSGGVLGAGNDGADDMDGGFGFDTASYADHGGVPVTVTLDGVANDGATGLNEGDDAGFGIEAITGGLGADVLIGDANGNLIIGGLGVADGGDLLTGNAGNDDLRGGFGNDTLNCGAGTADIGNGNEGTGDAGAPLHGCETLLGVP